MLATKSTRQGHCWKPEAKHHCTPLSQTVFEVTLQWELPLREVLLCQQSHPHVLGVKFHACRSILPDFRAVWHCVAFWFCLRDVNNLKRSNKQQGHVGPQMFHHLTREAGIWTPFQGSLVAWFEISCSIPWARQGLCGGDFIVFSQGVDASSRAAGNYILWCLDFMNHH